MEENKAKKISLSTIFLILSLIVIIVMGIFMYKFYNEKTESINSNNSNINTTTEKNDIDETNSDFEKLMNKLYLPKEYRDDSTTYKHDVLWERDFISSGDDIEWIRVLVAEDKIQLDVEYAPNLHRGENISTTIKGINEEVVDMTLETYEAEPTPAVIVLLTREGNVYYLTDFSDKAELQKIEELSKIVKIEKVDKAHDDAYHTETATIAIDKDGNYIDLDKYIYSNDNTASIDTTSFTDEQVKTALSNYLELRAHMNCNALLNNLTEKGVLNYDDSKDIDTIIDGTYGHYITNIKYSDYRNAMLKYVSKSEFERNWNSYYSEDSNGNLIAGDGGGGLRVYTIKSITKTNDSTYSAKVTSVVEDGEYFEEENLTFAVTSNNGICVIDSLK